MKILLFISTLLCSLNVCLGQTAELKKEIENIIRGKNLKLGFAFYDFSSDKAISINGNDKYPMQSVFKSPIEVALLDCVSKGEFSLTDSVTLTKADLSPDGRKWLVLSALWLFLVKVSFCLFAHRLALLPCSKRV